VVSAYPSSAVRASTETFSAIARAKAAGDQAEVERLKAEFQQRAAGIPAPLATSDPLERLETLAALHDRGVLTDAEFAAEKAKILGADGAGYGLSRFRFCGS
jgi:hypothetical protein